MGDDNHQKRREDYRVCLLSSELLEGISGDKFEDADLKNNITLYTFR